MQEISEKIGSGMNQRDRLVLSLHFKDVTCATWDHQHTSVKFDVRPHGGGGAYQAEPETGRPPFLTLQIENSLELERNLGLRFVGAVREQLLSPGKAPSFSYIGMFAGPTKPKPFERKRANLTVIKQGKMPPLVLMRQLALERHSGSERPMSSEVSRRKKLALDHIHDGVVAFSVFHAAGAAGLSEMACNNARLVLDDDGVVFTNDVAEVGMAVASTTTRRMVMAYADVLAWSVVDSAADVTRNGEHEGQQGQSHVRHRGRGLQ